MRLLSSNKQTLLIIAQERCKKNQFWDQIPLMIGKKSFSVHSAIVVV